jgi:hypothetical protein
MPVLGFYGNEPYNSGSGTGSTHYYKASIVGRSGGRGGHTLLKNSEPQLEMDPTRPRRRMLWHCHHDHDDRLQVQVIISATGE